MRLVDFQIAPSGLRLDEERALNLALFATFEPVRLWLRERRFVAPLRNIVVSRTPSSE